MKDTRKAIQNELLKQMKSKNVYAIKVTQITQALHISRSTFYLYYDSIFSVLQEIEDDFFNNLRTITSQYFTYPPNAHYLNEPHPIMLKIFTYLKENKDTAKVLLGPYGDARFQLRCHDTIANGFFPPQIYPSSTKEEEYDRVYMVYGHLGLVNHWINHDCDYDVKEFTLLCFRQIYKNTF